MNIIRMYPQCGATYKHKFTVVNIRDLQKTKDNFTIFMMVHVDFMYNR